MFQSLLDILLLSALKLKTTALNALGFCSCIMVTFKLPGYGLNLFLLIFKVVKNSKLMALLVQFLHFCKLFQFKFLSGYFH